MIALRRAAHLAGLVGPAIFIADWAALGATASNYDPVHDTISRLAETGAPTQAAMTVGFALYGSALPLFAEGTGHRLAPATRAMVAVTGLSTLVVAAFPVSARTGAVHAVAAGVGYLALGAAPLTHACELRRSGRAAAAAPSVLAGVACWALLAASVAAPVTGVLQRAGLTVGDVWIAGQAVAALRAARSAGPVG